VKAEYVVLQRPGLWEDLTAADRRLIKRYATRIGGGIAARKGILMAARAPRRSKAANASLAPKGEAS